MADWGAKLDAAVDALAEEARVRGGILHAHPEPSREEYRTAQYLAGRLGEAGLPRRLIPSRRGVVAGPEYGDNRPRVAIRADIDALRIHDLKDGRVSSSTRDGVMHACGHDAHAAMGALRGRALARSGTRGPGSPGRPPGGRSSSRPRKAAKGRSR